MPSGNEGAAVRAASMASRVLPTPPGPVSVTSRWSANNLPISRTSASRPSKAVSGVGSRPALKSTGAEAGSTG